MPRGNITNSVRYVRKTELMCIRQGAERLNRKYKKVQNSYKTRKNAEIRGKIIYVEKKEIK